MYGLPALAGGVVLDDNYIGDLGMMIDAGHSESFIGCHSRPPP